MGFTITKKQDHHELDYAPMMTAEDLKETYDILSELPSDKTQKLLVKILETPNNLTVDESRSFSEEISKLFKSNSFKVAVLYTKNIRDVQVEYLIIDSEIFVKSKNLAQFQCEHEAIEWLNE